MPPKLRSIANCNAEELARINEVDVFFAQRHPKHRSSRIGQSIAQVRSIFAGWATQPEAAQLVTPDTINAYAQFRMLWRVVHSYDALAVRNPTIAHRLTECVNGAFIPRSEGGDTGREAESELNVGAVLEMAGYRPRYASTGPDWRLPRTLRPMAVEVKRPASWEKVRARISEASEQLHLHCCPGLAWIDLSSFRTTPLNTWKVQAGLPLAEVLAPQFRQWVIRHRTHWSPLTLDECCVAVAFYAAHPVSILPDGDELARRFGTGEIRLLRGESPSDALRRLEATGKLETVGMAFAETIYVRVRDVSGLARAARSLIKDVSRALSVHPSDSLETN